MTGNMQRSMARRAVLTKSAAVDPAQVIGALGMLGGGYLGGSATTGDDQSIYKRTGKIGIGAGLGYAGYKAMTDPKWQNGINKGVDWIKDLIRAILNRTPKVAEAGPISFEDAYLDGFCKAAEVAGVDPVALAQYGQLVPAQPAR